MNLTLSVNLLLPLPSADKKVHYTGDTVGAWRALDDDMSGVPQNPGRPGDKEPLWRIPSGNIYPLVVFHGGFPWFFMGFWSNKNLVILEYFRWDLASGNLWSPVCELFQMAIELMTTQLFAMVIFQFVM